MPQEGWNSDGVSEDNSKYIADKNWTSNDDMVTSIRELETKMGSSITLPSAEASEDDFNAFYTKIGRPDTSDGYTFKMGENGDKEHFDWYKKTAYDVGLSDAQTTKLGEMYDKQMTESYQAALESSEKELDTLKTKYGADYDSKVTKAKAVVKGLGLDDNQLVNIEDQMGSAIMMDLFITIGDKIGEGAFNGTPNDGGVNIQMTKEQALEEIESFNNDKEKQNLYKKNDPKTVKFRANLFKIAYPD